MRSTVKLLPGTLFFTRLTFTVQWRPVSSSHFCAAVGVPLSRLNAGPCVACSFGPDRRSVDNGPPVRYR